ncbi:hypothetical protein D1AOALGA4SA_10590 [Olavius algarvensis Delta 1 endosymbiont]|nr:hypothetical protein D1AOALGA4SA_10590 [Olavius algarvensis Delta 1 endosymbiont]
MSGFRRQKTDDRGQKTEDRHWKLAFDKLRRGKVGMRNSEVWMRPLTCSPRLARGLSLSNGRRDKIET